MPIATAFRRQDHLDNRHPSYVGHAGIDIDPKLAAAIRSADLLVVVGEGLGDVTTGGYTLVAPPKPAQYLVHAHPSQTELGRVYRADLPILSTGDAFARALARLKPPAKTRWSRLRRDLRAAYERSLKPLATAGRRAAGGSHRGPVARTARRRHRYQRGGQLRRLPAPLLPVQGLADAAGADFGLDGLRPAGGDSRASSRTPIAPWWRSPATAAC